jgi:hypothetical protein
VAEKIQSEFGVECPVVFGQLAEFSVWLDDQKLTSKSWFRTPSDEKILDSVRQALA